MAEFGGRRARTGGLKLPLTALLLAALLVFELSYDWSPYAAPPAAVAAQPPVDPASRIIELLGPKPEYGDYLAAPVLDAERRPIVLPDKVSGEASTNGQIILLGTVVAGEGRIALFRVQGETGIIRARPGDLVGDWRVTDLQARTVKLERSGKSMQLTLPENGNGGQ